LTHDNDLQDKLKKEESSKRLIELCENLSSQAIGSNPSDEQLDWYNRKMPDDPFRNLIIEDSLPDSESKEEKPNKKKVTPITKYSFNGRGNLYEAVIINSKPYFISFTDGKLVQQEQIEENTRILRPLDKEEYPYVPYEFESIEELQQTLSKAQKISKDELYANSKAIFRKFVDQDEHVLNLLSMDSIWTYFQDLFPATHYVECIGTNDVGKSTIGYTFEYTGYRVIKATSISGANYYRMLGSIEPGQCVIIEDEGDNISEDSDKVRILKNGYEFSGKVPKINMNSIDQKQIWYRPYCFKMILAERSLSQWKAKGLVDRTFTLHCRPGSVKYSIKEVITEISNKEPFLNELSDDLMFFRKLLLCYRLVSYTNPLPNIETGLKNRFNELCKPLLQFFWDTNSINEIKETLQVFIDQRKDRIQNSIEAIVYPKIEYAVSELGNVIDVRDLWRHITDSLDGYFDTDREGNKTKPTLFHSENHGDLYMKTMTALMCDKFGAKLKHRKTGNVLVFDREYLIKIGKAYGPIQGIQAKILDRIDNDNIHGKEMLGDSDIIEGESGDPSDSTLGKWDCFINPSLIKKFGCSAQKLDVRNDNRSSSRVNAESPESYESFMVKDIKIPFIVTSTGTKFYRCPFYVEGCKIQNIYPEEIQRHVQYKHGHHNSQIDYCNPNTLGNITYGHQILLNSVIPRTRT
jgi:hypothetical protein